MYGSTDERKSAQREGDESAGGDDHSAEAEAEAGAGAMGEFPVPELRFAQSLPVHRHRPASGGADLETGRNGGATEHKHMSNDDDADGLGPQLTYAPLLGRNRSEPTRGASSGGVRGAATTWRHRERQRRPAGAVALFAPPAMFRRADSLRLMLTQGRPDSSAPLSSPLSGGEAGTGVDGAGPGIGAGGYEVEPTVVPTVLCQICLENVDCRDLVGPSGCEHRVACAECVCAYLTGKITERGLRNPCVEKGCSEIYSAEDVRRIVEQTHGAGSEAAAAVLRRYERFEALEANPDLRDCPTCGKEGLLPEEEGRAEMTCPNCGTDFCFYHASAHPGQDCRAYARQLRLAEEDDSNDTVRRTTKRCPQCSAATEKNGGCNHMTCSSCRANWCWICGSEFADTRAHYATTPLNTIFGCAGRQFTDTGDDTVGQHNYYVLVRAWRILIRVWFLIDMLIMIALLTACCVAWLPVGLILYCALVRFTPTTAKACVFGPAIAMSVILGCIIYTSITLCWGIALFVPTVVVELLLKRTDFRWSPGQERWRFLGAPIALAAELQPLRM